MHDFVPLVGPDDLPAALRAQWDATTRPGLRDFVRVMAHAPDHFQRYNDAYGPLRFDNHLGPRLTEIVRLNVAQTTRCQVCVAAVYSPTQIVEMALLTVMCLVGRFSQVCGLEEGA